MAQQVVTELVIDANTAGADQYAQAMDKAQSITSTTVLQIAGVSLAVVGAMTALRGFVDYVGTTNKQLIDLDRNALAAGMSTKEFQQTLFAARTSGLTEKDFVSGLDRITQDLVQASRGVTDFRKLFEANGLSINDVNGKLKDTKTAVNDIAGLMRNASPQVQEGIARIVGVSKDWIPFLQEGSAEIERQKQLADDLGLIIDDATVQKAKEFDQQWRIAVASWDTQFKKSLTELLPMMVKLAGYAIWILDAVSKAGGALNRSLTEPEDMGSYDLTKTLDQVTDLNDQFGALGSNASEFQKFKVQNALGGAHFKGEATQKSIDEYQDYLQDLLDAKTEIATPTSVVGAGGTTKLPAIGGDTADAYDRARESVEKYTARITAEAQAQGMGAQALQEYKAAAQLKMAAEQAGIPITDKVKDQIQDLAQDAGDAALALAKAKVANDNLFNAKAAFLTPEDLQIATQLKGIYGNDIPAALNSTEAAGMRAATALRDISNLGQDVNRGFLTDFVSGIRNGTNWLTALGNAGANALAKIADKLAGMAADGLWKAAFGGSGSGLLGNLFGGASNGSLTAGATWSSGLGAGTGGLSFPMFASGTDSAPGGWSIVGEEGPELVKLPARAQVFPAAQTAKMVAANGNDPVVVHAEIGVTVDDDGNLKAYVKNVSQKSTSDGIAAYSKSSAFVSHVAAASTQGRKRRAA